MSIPTPPSKFSHIDLLRFSTALLMRAGLREERAARVSDTLVTADLMGHSTHGLALMKAYLEALENGGMTKEGDPTVIRESGATLALDGNYLPGAWLVHQAIDHALSRIESEPVVTVTIQRSHHIGSLASYPERATERNMMMLLTCSDPKCELVAPFGGLDAQYSPNPIAAGIPTSGRPIIFDTSMSTTAFGAVLRARSQGKRLPAPWLLNSHGEATDDPNAEGTILPIGGLDHGYKGFALGILVEALTSGLAGHGRRNSPGRWGCSVFLQLIDPAAFGGADALLAEMDHFVARAKQSRTRPGDPQVRLPGERALSLRERHLQTGVILAEGIEPLLEGFSKKWDVPMPGPI